MTVASVIPLLRLVRGLGAFDYAVPETLAIEPGMVVRIPFRKKTVRGFVIEVTTKKRSRYALESIKSIVSSQPLLTPHAIEALHALHKHTLAPLPLLFRTFLPHIPTRTAFGDLPALPPCGSEYKNLRLPSSSIPLLRKLLTSKKVTVFHWHTNAERVVALLKLLERHTASGSVLILFPNTESIALFCKYLPPHLERIATILTSALTPAHFFSSWTSIARGEKRIVLATRTGLLAPLQHIACVIVEGEEQYGWKEEQNPRYDARIAAAMIANTAHVPCVFSSPSPTLETLHHYRRSIVRTPEPTRRSFLLDDIQNQLSSNDYSYIGPTLAERLQRLQTGQSALLFLNRRGFGTTVLCNACQRIIVCKQCALPLTHHKDASGDILRCHHCLHIEPIPMVCAYCGSAAIRTVGKGIERIEQDIKERFPHADIQCVTYPFLNTILWQQKTPVFIGVIDALSPLHMPDFRAMEHIWQFLDKLTAYTAHHRIPLVIQTYAPSHPAFHLLSSESPNNFYVSELTERKKYNYPPFIRLIKLIVKDEHDDKARKRAHDLHTALSLWNCSKPYPAHPARQHKKFVWNLLLRIPPKQSLVRVLKNLPKDVIIDVDPESTLE